MVTSLHQFIDDQGGNNTPPIPRPAEKSGSLTDPVLSVLEEPGWFRLQADEENPLDALYENQSAWAGFWHADYGLWVLTCRQNPWQDLGHDLRQDLGGLNHPPYRMWHLYDNGTMVREWHELIAGTAADRLAHLLHGDTCETIPMACFLPGYLQDDTAVDQLFRLIVARKDVLIAMKPVLYRELAHPVTDCVLGEGTIQTLQYKNRLLKLLKRLSERQFLAGISHVMRLGQAISMIEATFNRLAPAPLHPYSPAFEQAAALFQQLSDNIRPSTSPVFEKPARIRA